MSQDFSELGEARKPSAYKKYENVNDSERKNIRQVLKFMQQENYKDAEIIYKDLIKEGSNNYVVFGNLATICYMKNRIEEMIVLLKRALKLNPDYPEGLSNLGLALQKQGNLQAAIQLYEKALAIKPDFPNALRNLGNVFKNQGELQKAADCYRKVLAIEPNSLGALINLSSTLKEQGELQGAIDFYSKALPIEPNSLGALFNLGSALQVQGELQEAIDCHRKALLIDPNSFGALVNLGSALQGQGKLQEAINCHRKALVIDPNSLAALINLGSALQGQGESQEAINYYKKALAIDSNCLRALNNLGGALVEKGEFQEAIDYCKKTLTIDPNSLRALNNLAAALVEKGEFQEAIDCCRKALTIKPDYLVALINLGAALAGSGELQESITTYRKAIALNGNHSSIHWNLSLSLLSSGDYENGWKEYEWRFRDKVKLHGQSQLKKWDGGSHCSGDRLILISEQGLGDTLQFIRYIPYLNKKGMMTTLCAQSKLHGLIQASGITTEVYGPEDVHKLTKGEWLPLLSLPGYLNIKPNKLIVSEPYIKAPEENILYWKQKLSSEGRPIIGINWQGDPKTERAVLKGRSLPLEAFLSIIETVDASFLSLQKGSGSEQLTDCKFLDRFVGCQEEINLTWDFVENAAIMMNCDLIITVDTVVAHLAGGLGKPTWLLLHKVPDWRWGMEGDTTLWYPSMRLFRQREQGNWQEVMNCVAMALEGFFSNWPEPSITTKTPSPRNVSSIMAPVALAELIDKITILEIKSEKFKNEHKRNVDHELDLLRRILRQASVELLPEHHQQLKAVNESLWQIEEDIRSHETNQDFGKAFVQLARSVYLQNDKRAAIKKTINDYYGSEIIEEKSY